MWILSDKEYSLSTEKPSDISKRLLDTIDSCWNDYYCEWQINGIFNEWKKDFFSAWFDVDKNKVLQNFDAQKVKYLEDKLDKVLEEVWSLLHKYSDKTREIWKRIQELDKKEIETSLRHIPILEVTLKTQTEDTTLILRHLEGFNPQNKPWEKIDVKKLGLAWVLSNEPSLNLETTLLLDNPETKENEWIKKLANYLENTYFKNHPEVLSSFWIRDIKHITPKQAVQLASYIPMERIKYSQAQVWNLNWLSRNNTAEINDNAPIDKLFDWENDKSWNWVCRNYASVAIWVLEAIKILQDENNSLLNNIYALYVWSSSDNTVPWFVYNHAWNWYINFSRDKNWKVIADGLVLDSTWWDSDSLSSDPARVSNNEVKLDYTDERFFTLVSKFERASLLPLESYLPELLENYKNSPKLSFNQSKEDLLFPRRLFIWFNIINNLGNINKLPDGLKKLFWEFIKLFLDDIEDYIKSFENVSRGKELWNIYILLKKLDILFGICKNNWIFEGEDSNYLINKYQNIVSNLSKQEWNSFYYDLDFINIYVLLSDKIWDYKTLEEQFIILRKWFNYDKDKISSKLNDIYSDISEEWKKVFLKIFPDFKVKIDKKDDISIIKDRIKKKFNISIFGSIYDDKKSWEIKEFLLKLEHILADLSFSDLLSWGINLNLNSKPWKLVFSEINLDLSMIKEQIIAEIERHKKHTNELIKVKQTLNCVLEVDNLEFSSISEIESFLQNLRIYFSWVPDNLVRYKKINISSTDEIKNYANPTISKEHFIKWDFDKINQLLSDNDVSQYEHLYYNFDIKKKFQNLRDDYDCLKDVIVDVKDTNLWKIDSYYDELKWVLGKFSKSLDYKWIEIRIVDVESELYSEEAKSLFKEWYSPELLKILSIYYAKQFVSTDGTIKVTKTSLSKVLEIREVSNINNISIFIWDEKTWNKSIDEARERLKKSWNPIKITEIKKWIFYSNWIEIHITKWDKIIPNVVKWKVTQGWVITLYSNNSKDEISKELATQIERYKKFKDNLNRLKELLSWYTKVKPRYDFSVLNHSIEYTLERAIKIFKENPFPNFGGELDFEIWEDLIELNIKKYNTDRWEYEDKHTKVIKFWNLTDKQIFSQIK